MRVQRLVQAALKERQCPGCGAATLRRGYCLGCSKLKAEQHRIRANEARRK